jgi:hypothetical protein
VDALDRLFRKFAASTLVFSYASSAFPDLQELVKLMRRYKADVAVHQTPHRYSFGTHGKVSAARTLVQEYLIVGQ